MSLFDRLFGRHANAYYRRGMSAYNAEHYEEALVHFRRVLDSTSQPSDPLRSLALFYAAEAAMHLASSRMIHGKTQAALEYLEPAMEWNARSPQLQLLAALAYAELDQPEASGLCLQSALEQDPDCREAQLLLALRSFQREANAEAYQALECAGSCHSTSIPARILRRVFEPYLTQFPELESALLRKGTSPQSTNV